MRNLIFTAIAATATMMSTSAFAAGSAEIAVNASLAQTCSVVSATPTIVLTGTTSVSGSFVYKCNFTGSPTLKFASLNGGVKSTGTEGGTIDYFVNAGDGVTSAGPGNDSASSMTGAGRSYGGLTSTAANAEKTTGLAFALSTALTVAGEYQDTMTITVTP